MKNSEISESLISARDEYIAKIKAELMGSGSELSIPDSEHELISSSPVSRYSVGILFPQGNEIEQDNDETMDISDEETTLIFEQAEETDEESVQNNDHSYTFDETADENLDEEIGMATQYKPSSMGITFLVEGNPSTIHCKVSFATYRSALIPDCVVPCEVDNPERYSVPTELAHIMTYDKDLRAFRLISKTSLKELRDIFERDTIPENEYLLLKNVSHRLNDFLMSGYVRIPHCLDDAVITFGDSNYSENPANENLDNTSAKIVALKTKVADNIYSVTVMLVNGITEQTKANLCIFQSSIEISTKNNDFVFVESNPNADTEHMDDEEKSLELLYRHKKIYGTGLGTSADWNVNIDGQGKIWTDFFPIKEIPSMSFSLPKNEIISDEELSMKYLSDLDKTDKNTKLQSMQKLVDLYSSWIKDLQTVADSLDKKYRYAARKNIAECTRAAKRMYRGIDKMRENENAFNAFQLANRAMFMQRVHIQKQGEMSRENADRYPEDEEISDWLCNLDYYAESDNNCKWRPFQIAFLLMDIVSIVDDENTERNLVDLIWFPTGGGKTEAYLGLTAFTIFYRKLAYQGADAGTAVMMRYTLRLLAAQQFTRAATLICACEYIRLDSMQKRHLYPSYPLGKSPITIGLWIGGAHIPNNNEGAGSAKYHLEKLQNVSNHYYVRNEKERHNKFQVLKCPWCGTKLVKDDKDGKLVGQWGYGMRNGKHFYMFCPHEDCHFTKQLPIQIIDEELYSNPPTLLFGTVDKFAMMAWDGRITSFFGNNSDNRSPELIVQDELHLISGALGTMVGLYETAIDGLSSMKGVKPKVIASTATIRRAKEQCSVLYNREIVQFPAPGLDAEDSFFAKEDSIDYSVGKYGRKYVGIMPSGRTKAMTEIRSMAALLQKVYTMNLPDAVKDKLWTLTVYFNSLKDLGKAATLVDDDVKDFIIRTANRMFTSRRLIVNSDELTSRVSTTELNETLDKLEKIEYSKENLEAKRYASNVLLATNMISVGIDVARLNVMLMVGQPKLTSEYIQASSRVGRSFPGVVFVQYDATKSRDRSHYERFRAYHDSFYRFVEPTGATPFSKPARERGLHAVVTALLRQMNSLSQDKDADYFDKEVFAESIEVVEKYIVERIQGINNRSEAQLRDDIEDVVSEIHEFLDYWQNTVDQAHEESDIPVVFGRRYMVTPPAEGARRLFKQYNSSGKDDSKETLTSMRNVDTSVNGSIIIWEE